MWQKNQYEANFTAPTIFKVLEEETSFSRLCSFSHNFSDSISYTNRVCCLSFVLLLDPHQPLNITPDTHV